MEILELLHLTMEMEALYWIGKGDMWATNTDVNSPTPGLHSDTFYTSISGGLVHMFPSDFSTNIPHDYPMNRTNTSTHYPTVKHNLFTTSSFTAVQDLYTATVNLTITSTDLEIVYGPSFIASDENTLIIPITFTSSVIESMNWTVVLATETSWNLPILSGMETLISPSIPWSTKQGVTDMNNFMILMPCDISTYVYYPAISTFTILENNLIILQNNTFANNTNNIICLSQENSTQNKLTIQPCDSSVTNGNTAWQLVNASLLHPNAPPNMYQLQRIDDSSICAWRQGSAFHNSGGFIYVGECSAQETDYWVGYDSVNQQIKYNDTQCLTAVPPNVNVTFALAGGIIINADNGNVLIPSYTNISNDQPTVSTATAIYSLEVNTTYYMVATIVASPRDTSETYVDDKRLRSLYKKNKKYYQGIYVPDDVKQTINETDPLRLAIEHITQNYLNPPSNLQYLQERMIQHSNYWNYFWTNVTPEIYLGSNHQLLEGFYYGSQYNLALTTRPQEVFPGLWGVFTSDTPGWNGDHTLDYNVQANIYGSASSNHMEQIIPYLDQIASDWHLTLSALRANANWLAKGSAAGPGATSQSMACGYMENPYEDPAICPNITGGHYEGIEFTTHIGPYPGLYYFADLSLRMVAAMSTKPFIDYIDYTMDIDYLNSTVFPLLEQVADFYVSYVVYNNSTNQYDILNSCAQEICGGGPNGETNPHHDIGFLQITLQALIKYSSWLNNRDSEKIIQYKKLLNNLPSYPIDTYTNKNNQTMVVFLEADNTLRYFNSNAAAYCIVYLAAIHPAEVISLSTVNNNLVNISYNTIMELSTINNWHPLNGLGMMWIPASRIINNDMAEEILTSWENALQVTMYNNYYPDLQGGGIEQFGASEAINSIFVQSQEGFIRFYSMWPLNQNASFTRIRARGGYLITSSFTNGQVVSPIIITVDSFINDWIINYNCTFLNPWSTIPKVWNNNTQMYVEINNMYINNVSVYTFTVENGSTYLLEEE